MPEGQVIYEVLKNDEGQVWWCCKKWKIEETRMNDKICRQEKSILQFCNARSVTAFNVNFNIDNKPINHVLRSL